MKRTFVAIKVEAGTELLSLFSTLKSELKSDLIKWTDTNQIHITLAFLGDTTDEKIKKVSSMLAETVGAIGTFSFKISGMGVFRNIRDARVLWAGVEDTDELVNLFGIIKSGLEASGVTPEGRSFSPHITLGRIKLIKELSLLESLIKQSGRKFFQTVKVSEVVYYESMLRPTGAVYIPIAVYKLKV